MAFFFVSPRLSVKKQMKASAHVSQGMPGTPWKVATPV
jgi:hypothetical protein